MPEKKISEEVKFLHDIATPIASVRLLSKRFLAQMKGERPVGSPADTALLVERILQATADLETLHAKHKEYLFNKESA